MARRAAVYPGSFDPVTRGHLDIIARAAALFDTLIVAVAENPAKTPLFTAHERMGLIQNEVQDLRNVTVDTFSGLLVGYAKQQGCGVVVRSLRAMSHFDEEFQMAVLNSEMMPELETVFLMTDKKYFYLSSSVVKDLVARGGDASRYVTPKVLSKLKEKLGRE